MLKNSYKREIGRHGLISEFMHTAFFKKPPDSDALELKEGLDLFEKMVRGGLLREGMVLAIGKRKHRGGTHWNREEWKVAKGQLEKL